MPDQALDVLLNDCKLRDLVRDLVALLREFEQLPVRRLTSETTVVERGPLDVWRARCGQAVLRAESELRA